MSLPPGQPSGTGVPKVGRTVIFWVLMVALALMFWQMTRTPVGSSKNRVSYSDFLQQLDKNNVAAATFTIAPNTDDVAGSFRDPAQEYRTTIPRDDSSQIIERLRKQGASVSVSESTNQNWQSWILNLLPLIILVGFWIFMMKTIRPRQTLPPTSPL